MALPFPTASAPLLPWIGEPSEEDFTPPFPEPILSGGGPKKGWTFALKKDKKNLTAEVAEHAEVEMAKSSEPGCRGKNGVFSHPSQKVKTAKGLSRNDLCALCFLFVHPLVSIPG